MTGMRTLIVDDERLARVEMRRLLQPYSQIEIIGEAEDAGDAISKIEELKPELVFLDIQMPGKSGFEVLEAISHQCRIIFVTAHDRFAVRAFEVNAIDYLLKPVDPERLAQSLRRLNASPVDTEIVRQESPDLTYQDHLFLPYRGRSAFVPLNKISAILAAGDYSEVCVIDAHKRLTQQPLRVWEDRLPSNKFLRIHRSAIVNLEHIKSMDRRENYTYDIQVEGLGKPLSMSRRYAARIKDLLK